MSSAFNLSSSKVAPSKKKKTGQISITLFYSLEAFLNTHLNLIKRLVDKARGLCGLHQRICSLLPRYFVEGVPAEQPGEDKEELLLGEFFAEADATAAAEWEETLRQFSEKLPVIIQKSLCCSEKKKKKKKGIGLSLALYKTKKE